MNDTVLTIEHLRKQYGELVAVKDLSLQISQGELFGILGPNGAGKTTSINMICGLLKPDGGRVTLHGKPLVNGNTRTLPTLGFCPQKIVLWDQLTCLEQIVLLGRMYGMTNADAHTAGKHLLDELDLAAKTNALARTLSGGMQRRLNLAMALVHDPEIVVLDEPEAGLDPQSRIVVREYIQSLARRKTVILTTHDMEEADRLADRVAILDHGELLELDRPEALKARLGTGDVIEFRISDHEDAETRMSTALETLKMIVADGSYDRESKMLRLRSLNAVNQLPTIMDRLHQVGIESHEMTIHANTLEDVFIHLTGRAIRDE